MPLFLIQHQNKEAVPNPAYTTLLLVQPTVNSHIDRCKCPFVCGEAASDGPEWTDWNGRRSPPLLHWLTVPALCCILSVLHICTVTVLTQPNPTQNVLWCILSWFLSTYLQHYSTHRCCPSTCRFCSLSPNPSANPNLSPNPVSTVSARLTIRVIFTPYSSMEERPSELRQSRGNPLKPSLS